MDPADVYPEVDSSRQETVVVDGNGDGTLCIVLEKLNDYGGNNLDFWMKSEFGTRIEDGDPKKTHTAKIYNGKSTLIASVNSVGRLDDIITVFIYPSSSQKHPKSADFLRFKGKQILCLTKYKQRTDPPLPKPEMSEFSVSCTQTDYSMDGTQLSSPFPITSLTPFTSASVVKTSLATPVGGATSPTSPTKPIASASLPTTSGASPATPPATTPSMALIDEFKRELFDLFFLFAAKLDHMATQLPSGPEDKTDI